MRSCLLIVVGLILGVLLLIVLNAGLGGFEDNVIPIAWVAGR
ncbi:MAG TPA: hypothetical protein PKD59_02950 [Miltoncostaeaceae bacterium]|nr:hypothetical protein [Miltoncostaeaceae bacterium]